MAESDYQESEHEDSKNEDSSTETPDIHTYPLKPRGNPQRRKEKVYIGCGAGFCGDRPLAAMKLLQRVNLDYIVLECLAERTLVDLCHDKEAGGQGYDPRLEEWMRVLLPLAVEKGTCIITNMGALCALEAQDKVLEVASSLEINVTVSVAHQFAIRNSALDDHLRYAARKHSISTYLGAAPIVECLEKYKPDVIITSRVADASLFLAPMSEDEVKELPNSDPLDTDTVVERDTTPSCRERKAAEVVLEAAGKADAIVLGDKYRDMTFQCLLDISLSYADVSFDGKVCVAKADGSGGVLNVSTCSQQLLYEVGDPGAYITPDVIVDFRDVSFQPLSSCKVLCSGAKPPASLVPDTLLVLFPKDCGWRGWGEISYGGYQCVKRAEAAEYLVRSWMKEAYPDSNDRIVSYIIGLDSLKATTSSSINNATSQNAFQDIRLRMDGVFESKEEAIHFTKEFIALYTNGPAGGGGVSTGHKKEIILEKGFVGRDHVYVPVCSKQNSRTSNNPRTSLRSDVPGATSNSGSDFLVPEFDRSPAPGGQRIPLYDVAHSRTGDKGNNLNFSVIPHFRPDIERLKVIITPKWVKEAVSALLNPSSFPNAEEISKRDQWIDEHVKVEIYEARGISSLNVVVRNILDGGVNCSRRIDRHGKTISDLILSQLVVLP